MSVAEALHNTIRKTRNVKSQARYAYLPEAK
jgi:hypothetical protein